MRYAIYYLPDQESALWNFGSAVLGYDAIANLECAYLELPAASGLCLHDLTREPRPYGFHATLKAPFHLSDHVDERKLLSAVANFTNDEAPIDIGSLSVSRVGSFLALTPKASDVLKDFAGRCVISVDGLRASMTTAEREKRLRTPLTERQMSLLDKWGYPFVFDEFQFHLTLTSPLPAPLLDEAQKAIEAAYRMISSAVTITSVCVCVQPEGERFRLLERFRLARSAPAPIC